MRSELRVLAIGSCFWLASTDAAVYRCEIDGKLQFSDRACAAGAEPLDMPPVNTLHHDPEDGALAEAYDQRNRSHRKAREKADSDWQQSYNVRKQREADVRQGQLKGKVVKGMTSAQVRNLMGEPASKAAQDGGSGEEIWTYRDGKSTAKVKFKDGQVSSMTNQKKKSSDGGSGKK